MYRWQLNSSAYQVSTPTLARLVRNEPLPIHVRGWCVLHVRVGSQDAPRATDFAQQSAALIADRLAAHNMTHANCYRVHLLASATLSACGRDSTSVAV